MRRQIKSTVLCIFIPSNVLAGDDKALLTINVLFVCTIICIGNDNRNSFLDKKTQSIKDDTVIRR